ncbi:MAG: aminopeptidase, partial [Nitrospinota bacterium]
MQDPRITRLAQVLIGHSTRLQGGEKLLIEAIDAPPEIVIALIREARRVGGIPVVTLKSNQILRELYREATQEQMQFIGEYELYRMKRVDAYIGIRGSWNIAELSDVPSVKMQLYQRYWLAPVHLQQRVPHTKWVVLRWPTPSMAQQAEMSTEGFEQ